MDHLVPGCLEEAEVLWKVAFCPLLNNLVRSGRLTQCEKGEDSPRLFCCTDRDVDASATPARGLWSHSGG